MTGCLRTTLNDLLGADWLYQGQSADGGARLKRATDAVQPGRVWCVVECGWTVIQTDGTALLTLFGGQQFVLTPDLALGSVPPGTLTVWWQDGPNHYRYRNSSFSNTSQGFTVTPR